MEGIFGDNKRHFGGFVVTYDRPFILAGTIESILGQTLRPETILVVDNGSDPATEAVAKRFQARGVLYERTGRNLGSAGGFAYGVRRLMEYGYDWIYCGDDDNPPLTADTCERILALLKDSKRVGVAGAVGARFDWRRGELCRFRDEELKDTMEVDFVGQDQSFTISKEAVLAVGLPNAELFFGYPDLEYSLRIRRAGFLMLIDGDLMMAHRRRSGRMGLVLRQSAIPHRPLSAIWRNYYTTRSYIFMMRTIFDRPDLARREALKAIGRIASAWKKGIRYGYSFAGYQAKGVWDGYRGRLGPRIAALPKH